MKAFVWRRGQVLRNYASGMVVVAATDIEQAWSQIKQEDPYTWCRLQHQDAYYFDGYFDGSPDEFLAELIDDEPLAPGFPIQPEEFDLENLPVLIVHGGE